MIAAFLAALLAATVVSTTTDSVSSEVNGEGVVVPAFRIAHEKLGECSGIVWHDGAFFAHNDSGGGPELFRSPDASFPENDTVVLSIPGARAVDWEDIAVLDGDLIVGDIGDNFRRRSDLTLYRVRYVAEEGGIGRLELIGTYPFEYPDGPHDAEALAAVDGKVHLITKAREETVTHLYVFDDLRDASSLPPGQVNVPRLAAGLEIGEGEQVTAADYDPGTETLLIMTYTHLLHYPKGRIEGRPAGTTLIAARQCEALCFRGTEILFANEQRDVFAVDRFFARGFRALLPERGRTILPRGRGPFHVDGRGGSWRERGGIIPLANARHGDEMRWCLVDGHLLVRGELTYKDVFRSTDPRVTALPQLGSGALMVFSRSPSLELSGEEFQVWVGLGVDNEPSILQLDLTLDPIATRPLLDVEIEAEARDGVFTFEVAIPLSAGLADHIQDRFLFDVHGVGLHGEDEVLFSGVDLYTVFRPYIWGEVTLENR